MRILRQFGIIIGIFMVGEFINNILHVPIPGNIIGMVLLFIALHSKVIKLEMIEEVSEFLLKHLAFFFIAPGVALIALLDRLSSVWLSFGLILIISTILVMGITGVVVQQVIRRGEK
ncbi:CidA/LrgA family protein [Clostridium sp. D2Q-11]|uniref:CidA/LrgA family protein n=1 Tax=Anaeromonas frigoriresistens TaxID=2683708 RepID=A0A942Z9N6_9FIRM|nr:CidA/LrgA family protein [Anaeromonas frigoriresistens]MBS4539030.1 CidA/LrgA family protein [Anaeromonas frigoriresistens]